MAAPPPVVAGAASFAAQPENAITEAATRASGATIFFEDMCESSRASVAGLAFLRPEDWTSNLGGDGRQRP